MPHPTQYFTYEAIRENRARRSRKLDKANLWDALGQLWVEEALCDCILVSADQQQFHAHRLMLAAVSQYCKALFVGTGQIMSNNAAKHDEKGKLLVQLDEVDSYSLQLLLHAVYQTDFEVRHKTSSIGRNTCAFEFAASDVLSAMAFAASIHSLLVW